MAVTQIVFIHCQQTNVNNATMQNSLKQNTEKKSQFVYKQTLGSRD